MHNVQIFYFFIYEALLNAPPVDIHWDSIFWYAIVNFKVKDMISMFCFLLIILSYQGIFTFVDSEKGFRTFTFLSRVFLTCVALYKWKLWICKWRFDLSTMVLFHQWYNALSTMVQLYQYEKFLLSEGGGGVLSSSSIQLFNLEWNHRNFLQWIWSHFSIRDNVRASI